MILGRLFSFLYIFQKGKFGEEQNACGEHYRGVNKHLAPVFAHHGFFINVRFFFPFITVIESSDMNWRLPRLVGTVTKLL